MRWTTYREWGWLNIMATLKALIGGAVEGVSDNRFRIWARKTRDMSSEQRKTSMSLHNVFVCVYQLSFDLQTQGLPRLIATILNWTPPATQPLSLGVTTHRLAPQLLLRLHSLTYHFSRIWISPTLATTLAKYKLDILTYLDGYA